MNEIDNYIMYINAQEQLQRVMLENLMLKQKIENLEDRIESLQSNLSA